MSSTEIRRLMNVLEDANAGDATEVDQNKIAQLIASKFIIRGEWHITGGKVDVDGDVSIKSRMVRFPFKFGMVSGMFYCDRSGLRTLIGSPAYVGKSYCCENNPIKTLEGAPSEIGGSFYCYEHRLTSLDGLPAKVGDSYYIGWSRQLPLLQLVGKNWIDTEYSGPTQAILDKYIGEPSRANILACQKELIDAGFEGNASW